MLNNKKKKRKNEENKILLNLLYDFQFFCCNLCLFRFPLEQLLAHLEM